MYHMATISVRDLRYDFAKVEDLLRQGEEITITKRRKVIGRIVPENGDFPPLPDFQARVQKIYGDKVFDTSGADLLSIERNRL